MTAATCKSISDMCDISSQTPLDTNAAKVNDLTAQQHPTQGKFDD